MPSVCFYFQVHQPMRIKRYRVFDIGHDRNYFVGGEGKTNNEMILNKVAEKCYIPANKVILNLLKKHPEFRVSYSLSGVFLDQLREYAPHVLKSFQDLVATGQVELLSETYYHSLSFLYSKEEFRTQVRAHQKLIEELFGVTPTVFRNTELIYNNDIAREAEHLGFSAILAEGADHILGWRSPNFVYSPPETKHIRLLLKNYRLSDDIAFRFGSRDWKDYPLTSEKFANWISSHNGSGQTINLFMDYETFGEHQWEDTGIFHFLEALPAEVLKNRDNNFLTPSEVAERYSPVGELDVEHFMSWADIERDLSAWRSNDMQNEALRAVYDLERAVLASGNEEIAKDWRRLLTSDHFYYMCTKWFADGDVHKYFNPYETPYDAFISFMNVLKDMNLRLEDSERGQAHTVPIKKVYSVI